MSDNPLAIATSDLGISEMGSQGTPSSPSQGRRVPWGLQLVPFFLSALFYISAVFAVFAPLPILMMFFWKGRRWAWLAAITNAVLVAVLGGPSLAILYGVFILVLAFFLAETLNRGTPLFRAGVQTLTAVAFAAAIAVAVYAQVHHVNPWFELKGQVSTMVDTLAKSAGDNPSLLGTTDPGAIDEWKQEVMVEFPSAVAILSLILIWANSLVLLQRNPGGIREKLKLDAQFARRWKTPEFLVWPTIVSGVFLLFDAGRVSDISLNVFKVLMAVYALQGLSVLAFLFEVWKLKRFLRTIGFLVSFLLMMPLLLSLGFFDLWFDFRGKFRQS